MLEKTQEDSGREREEGLLVCMVTSLDSCSQFLYACPDLVADLAELFQRQHFWIGNGPIFVEFGRDKGAFVPATHRYDIVIDDGRNLEQGLGGMAVEPIAKFSHDGDRFWIDHPDGGTGAISLDRILCIQVRKCLSHLAAAGIFNTHEENAFLFPWKPFPAGGSHFLQGEVPSR